ncbi:hypothetical protein GCM10007103_27770 [Salinimicrobium marinum]|uniref:Uncharacterized protein n=1 Tax=Salinimicrobium marinum TaxID=680283 RepID=A0A918SK00_9FLAO|nr:hypothetical protein [Salinimicrobium marinum]GHA45029.1 hypothetical protein GCM10007103_27770 [Salinimicrobium marinum]
MKKKLFFGFTLFVMLFTMVAWQYASAELVELQNKTDITEKDYTKAA